MLSSVNAVFPENHFIYQHNCPIHTAICHSRCFGIRGGQKSAFKLAVKLSVELGYVFLSLRL
jgi:hypothetical protein